MNAPADAVKRRASRILSVDRSFWRRVLRPLLRRPAARPALFILAVMCVFAVGGSSLAPYGANEVDTNVLLAGPSWKHWFGTDELGRDVLSRVLIAVRSSLEISAVCVVIALVVGVTLGLVAGYYPKGIDTVIMRCMDVIFAFPALLLAVALVAVLSPGVKSAMIAIAIVYIPIFARITRAGVLSVRETTYVRASISIGSSDQYIITHNILPNVMSPIIVQTSLSFGFAILAEAGLSFLGLGVQPPEPSWGGMVYEGSSFLPQAWWLSLFPGLAILFAALAFNLLGDALRDVLEPGSRSELEVTAL
jgi:peptide/nickel transport system permease protein